MPSYSHTDMVRSPYRDALGSSYLLQIAFAVALGETLLRILLADVLHPFMYVLTPPVVAVLGFGLAAPSLRTRVFGMRRRYAVDPTGSILGRLVAIAVVGHVIAIVLGGGMFFIIDTAMQALIYGLTDFTRPPFVVFALPVLGVFVGTLVVWGAGALVVIGVSDGLSIRQSIDYALSKFTTRPVGNLIGLHLLLVVCVVISGAIGAPLAFAAESRRLFLAVAGVLTIVLTTVPLALCSAQALTTVRSGIDHDESASSARDSETDQPTQHPPHNPSTHPTQRSDIPVARLAIVLLLIISLATVAGAARMMELRPLDDTEALGEDPDEMFATALSNTQTVSHSVEWIESAGDDEPVSGGWASDREDRQIRWDHPNSEVIDYVTTGEQTLPPVTTTDDIIAFFGTSPSDHERGELRSPANYAHWADNPAGAIVIPELVPVEGWELVDEEPGTVTLALTDQASIFELAMPTVDDGSVNSVETTDVMARIDTESHTLAELDITIEAIFDGDAEINTSQQFRFETGIDVDRPDNLSTPSVEATVWRVLIY